MERALALQPGLMDAPGAAPVVALVAVLYARMLGGQPAMGVLRALMEGLPAGKGEKGEDVPLGVGEIAVVVKEEVDKVIIRTVCCLWYHVFGGSVASPRPPRI